MIRFDSVIIIISLVRFQFHSVSLDILYCISGSMLFLLIY